MNSTRLPLQLGANSLWHGFRGSATLVPGLIVTLGALVARWGGESWILYLGVGLLLTGYGAYQLHWAWLTRACDVLLDHAGIELDGGPHNGMRLAWSQIDLKQSSCKEDVGKTLRLKVGRHESEAILLASAEHPVEKDSLHALYSTLKARLSSTKPEPTRNPQLWSCQSCGASLVPIDADTVNCSYCGAANEAPQTLRGKLREREKDAANRQDIEVMVQALLEQPGARRASIVLSIYGLLSILPWIASVGTLVYLGFEYAGGFEIGFAFVAGLLGTLMLFVFARSALVKRRALLMITTAFSALKVGEQSLCRSCQAPLPSAEGQLLCRCAYCDAENVMGVDVSRRYEESEGHKESLEELIDARRRERRRWYLFAFVSFFLGGIAALMTLVSVIVAAEFADNVAKCKAGDAVACLDVSTDFYLGISVSKDEAKGFEYAQKSCEMKLAEGCDELSDYYYFGSGGVEQDEAYSDQLRAKACSMGHEPGCGPRE